MVAVTLRHFKSMRLMVCLSHGPVVCSAVSLYPASSFGLDTYPLGGGRKRAHAPDARRPFNRFRFL
jgi:hypothetical protein